MWIKEGSLEDVLGHAGCIVKAKHKAYKLYIVWSLSTGDFFLSGWLVARRIHPLIIVIAVPVESPNDSKKTRMGLHYPPPYLKKRKCVSTGLMQRAAFCLHQDTKTPSIIIAGPPTDQSVL